MDQQQKIKPEDAAKIMNKSVQFVRQGLIHKILPFGWAVQMPGGRYSYYISPELFRQYVGIAEASQERIV